MKNILLNFYPRNEKLLKSFFDEIDHTKEANNINLYYNTFPAIKNKEKITLCIGNKEALKKWIKNNKDAIPLRFYHDNFLYPQGLHYYSTDYKYMGFYSFSNKELFWNIDLPTALTIIKDEGYQITYFKDNGTDPFVPVLLKHFVKDLKFNKVEIYASTEELPIDSVFEILPNAIKC